MSLHLFVLAVALSTVAAAPNPCGSPIEPLLDALFPSLGNDCNTYLSLFKEKGKLYHQHSGYTPYSGLFSMCTSFGKALGGNRSKFLQNGEPQLVAVNGKCHMLVPYLWSAFPADPKAYMPHTGWEYLVVSRTNSKYRYGIELMAEIETTFSAPYNWKDPAVSTDLFQTMTIPLLHTTATSKHRANECDSPFAGHLASFFAEKSTGNDVWRQQGDAVVLAAGGVCHVTVPYAAAVGDQLKTGTLVFALQPLAGSYIPFPGSFAYNGYGVVDFPLSSTAKSQRVEV